MSKGTSHPNIAKLVRQIEQIDLLYMNDLYYDAWRAMRVVLRGLKPMTKEDKKCKSLLKALDYSINRLDSIFVRNFPDAQVKRISLARNIDANFQSRFMDVLWGAKMLSDGGYYFFDPSGGKTSDSVVIERGERDTSRIH